MSRETFLMCLHQAHPHPTEEGKFVMVPVDVAASCIETMHDAPEDSKRDHSIHTHITFSSGREIKVRESRQKIYQMDTSNFAIFKRTGQNEQ